MLRGQHGEGPVEAKSSRGSTETDPTTIEILNDAKMAIELQLRNERY
jgi:hypothetical protein